MIRNDKKGSIWRKWDFHFHTPASFDYQDKSITNEQLIAGLMKHNISTVAITDHHTIDVERIRNLQSIAGDNLTVFPGIELRSELGGSECVHYIGIFPENCDIENIWTKLSGTLNITCRDVSDIGDDRVYIEFKKGCETIHELGGLISVHAGSKSNSLERIKSTKTAQKFKEAVREDMVNKHIDILEIGALSDVEGYRDIVFPYIKKVLPIVICSDNHNINEYSVKTNCWLKADCTFKGLKHVIHEPDDRIYLGETPTLLDRVKMNKTKHISEIQLSKCVGSKISDKWFDGLVPLNPGLVGIIGNKGSGKSALADIIALLGDSHNGKHFSFLCRDKFRNSKNDYSQHFQAVIVWESGGKSERILNEEIETTLDESVKYLPQSYLEKICNDIQEDKKDTFSKELKSVIFSHVGGSEKLEYQTLDDLLNYQTEEKSKSIDLLKKRLYSEIEVMVDLERKSTTSFRDKVQNKINAKKRELEAHAESQPAEVEKPEIKPENKDISCDEIETIKQQIHETELEIAKSQEKQKKITREVSTAKKLIARIANLKTQIHTFIDDSKEDVVLLDLKIEDVFQYTVSDEKVSAKLMAATKIQTELEMSLSDDNEESLINKRHLYLVKLKELEDLLDRPNQEYQKYVRQLKEWKIQEKDILGDSDKIDTLKYHEHQLKQCDLIPSQLDTAWKKCHETCLKIHDEMVTLTKMYRHAFEPVQKFIEQHDLAHGRFNLQFEVSLRPVGFEDGFLDHINQNRKGSFSGQEDGRNTINTITEKADYETREGVGNLVNLLFAKLHKDHRVDPPENVNLEDQLRKSKTLNDLYAYILSLSYLQPKYTLQWEGKDVSKLSPGERGTLLLVFYLLIDRSDIPLIVDQPEENLDNQSVYDILVPSIKEAKSRRQIIMVTHNPNLAVVCDADQIICAKLDKNDGNRVTYISGAIENPEINSRVVDILEGTLPAFDNRDGKYRLHR